jgi:hypothetical protein
MHACMPQQQGTLMRRLAAALLSCSSTAAMTSTSVQPTTCMRAPEPGFVAYPEAQSEVHSPNQRYSAGRSTVQPRQGL